MLPTSERWDLSQDLRNTMNVLAKQNSPTKTMKSFQRREREKISNGERSQQREENEENTYEKKMKENNLRGCFRLSVAPSVILISIFLTFLSVLLQYIALKMIQAVLTFYLVCFTLPCVLQCHEQGCGSG